MPGIPPSAAPEPTAQHSFRSSRSQPRRPRAHPHRGGDRRSTPFFSVAFARYQQQHSRVTIGYSEVGSSAAITALNPGVSLGSNLRSVSG